MVLENFDLPKSIDINRCLKKLFPINRSLTGIGNKQTINILNEIVPLNIKEIKSNTQVYDWTIPPEWRISDGYIKNANGKKIVDWKNNNLSVVNYSMPVNKKVSKKELLKYLFTLEEHPDWVPYRTSYYNRDWGFCTKHSLLNSKDFIEPFEVFIDADFNNNGKLIYADALHKGESEEEILISSYLCHPSLANDNLSGILTAVLFFNHIKKIKTYYTYRLVLCPETIGALAFLSQLDDVKKIKCSAVITCTAGPGCISVKKSFIGEHFIDKLAQTAISKVEKNFIEYPFIPIGSDERQYSSPGFRIPTISICKSKYYEYQEYHTSADNLEFIKAEYLLRTLECYIKWFELIEKYHKENSPISFNKIGIEKNKKVSNNLKKKNIKNKEVNKIISRNMMKGDFHLSKYKLYESIGGPIYQNELQNAFRWIMHLADGKHSILDIAIKSNLDLKIVNEASSLFVKKGLLKTIK